MISLFEAIDRRGPAIVAVDPWVAGNPTKGRMRQLLTDDERTHLAAMASVVRFKKGEEINRSGGRAKAIFNIVSGVVKSCANGDENHIVAFLFPGDLFGLSSEGTYVNSNRAITPVTAYQLPLSALLGLSKNAPLEYYVICKLVQELLQAQRHAFLLSQKQAVSKIAIFLQMLEHLEQSRGEHTGEIYIPMDRSDIANYVSMSLPAVSRAFAALVRGGIIRNRDRRHVKIINRVAFENMVASVAVRRADLD